MSGLDLSDIITVKTPACLVCREKSSMAVIEKDYLRWKNGTLTQIAFPYMSADDRELLMTGTHPDCWENIFSSMDK